MLSRTMAEFVKKGLMAVTRVAAAAERFAKAHESIAKSMARIAAEAGSDGEKIAKSLDDISNNMRWIAGK